MARALVLLFLLPLTAASGAPAPLAAAPAPPAIDGASLSLDSASVLLQARTGQVDLALPVGVFRLQLEPSPLALGAVWGLDAFPMGVVDQVITFKGTANGHPVRLAATTAGVFTVIFTPDPIHIEPAWLLDPAAPVNIHRVLVGSQHPVTVFDDQLEPTLGRPVPTRVPTGGPPPPANRVARFLVEGDFSFYARFSRGVCDVCWVQAQQAVMNVAEQLFEPQTGVSFRITSQWACRNEAACPYLQVPFDAGHWLVAFQERWEGIQGEPVHDLGHLMVANDLPDVNGASAQASAATPFGYALSEVTAVGLPVNNGPVASYATPAHEIGHTLDGVHEEADPVPPLLAPTGPAGAVWTLMGSGKILRYQFSDGSIRADHNNVARIVDLAMARLPAT